MTKIMLRGRFLLVLLLTAGVMYADGVMRPTNTSYPSDFLRHKLTKVDVVFHGQVAITTVYQEFVNEWTQKVDAVYSFPLPRDARATDFLFWSNDSLFRAPLKVKEQAPNPGSGEGGIDALLTTYLGSNGLRVLLKDIPAGSIQRIQMEYVSLCRYDRGKLVYRYPLETAQFTNYPVDGVTVNFSAENVDIISSAMVGGWNGAAVRYPDAHHATASFDRSKISLTSDLTFTMAAVPDTLSVDMQAANIDTLGGHFLLFIKPQGALDSSRILPKNIVFLFDRTIYSSGENLLAAVQAAKTCLGLLKPMDRFNIRSFTYTMEPWRNGLSNATTPAIDSARAYLDAISGSISSVSSLEGALTQSFQDFPSDTSNSIIVLFSDGRAQVDPRRLTGLNTKNVAIYPVGVGSNVRWRVLEMLAYLNNGIPTVIPTPEDVAAETDWLFGQFNDPLLRGMRLEMGPNAWGLYPQIPRALYGGSRFFVTGRFTNPGSTSLAIAGNAANGPQMYGYVMAFPGVSGQNSYVTRLWAKERLDELERQIDVYGPTDSLKNLAISISLQYHIRCMYTAYVAEKTEAVSVEEDAMALLATAEAERTIEGVALRWSFLSASSVRGVFVYRSTSMAGPYARVTSTPVMGGFFLDHDAPVGDVWYKIELVMADGRRIMSAPIAGSDGPVPGSSALLQNYPNPFNPSTVIAYAVGRGAGDLSLVIYDALGREVRTLAAGHQPPGTYRVTWDGTDAGGRGVAAGFYFCRMRAGSYSRTRTLLLLK